MLRLPQLAIHLDREVNERGVALDRQHHVVPVWGLGAVDEGGFAAFMAKELGVAFDDVVAWDVMTHDLTPPSVLGVDGELTRVPAGSTTSSRCGAAQLLWPAASRAASAYSRASTMRKWAARRALARPARCSVTSSSASPRHGAAVEPTISPRLPRRCASRRTWPTPCIRTTSTGSSRATTSTPTADQSSRPMSGSGTRPTRRQQQSSWPRANGRTCRGRCIRTAATWRAVRRSGRSPPCVSVSPRSTSATRCCRCTRPARWPGRDDAGYMVEAMTEVLRGQPSGGNQPRPREALVARDGAPGDVLVDADVAGQAEHPLAEDVAHDLGGAALDRVRPRAEERLLQRVGRTSPCSGRRIS